MSDVSCTKSRSILERTRVTGGVSRKGAVVFITSLDEDEDAVSVPLLELAFDLYEEMGSPKKITVTVEPGDLLNEVPE